MFIPHVELKVDLMSGKASNWLTANREQLTSSAEDEFFKTVLLALEIKVTQDLEHMETSSLFEGEKKAIYSFFLEAMAIEYEGNWITLAQKLSKEWLNLNCSSYSEFGTYKDAFDQPSLLIAEKVNNHFSPEDCDLCLPGSVRDSTFLVVIQGWLKENKGTLQIVEAQLKTQGKSGEKVPQDYYRYKQHYQLKKDTQPYYSENALANSLIARSRLASSNMRLILHCDKGSRWSRIFLGAETRLFAHHVFDVVHPNSDSILLPFLFRALPYRRGILIECTDSQLDDICRWVKPNLQSQLAIDEIKDIYKDLINYIDNTVMANSPHEYIWRTYRGSPELN
jgi:hypothetical protein